ncbi:MAG: DUF2098 domain-containing protein [Methanomicrobiales archaeon]|nr:DUF2098 domain-containing protein [Methanomicrobiales archaeon]
MEAAEAFIGQKVRYPRTGTEGRIEAIELYEGEFFAAIDATHLRYRIDQLFPLEELRQKREGVKETIEGLLKKSSVSFDEVQDAFRHMDGECGG